LKQQPISLSHYIPLFLSILFIGTSGTLGRLIQLSPIAIICFRSIIAFILLAAIIWFSKKSFIIKDRRKRNFILLSGAFLAVHWVTYFFSLQLSSVALGMLSMFTYPVITVILEPFYLKKKFLPIQVPVALIALTGIYIMLPSFDLKNHHTLGIIIGVLSAFLYACRNLILKKYAGGQDEIVVITHQLAVVAILTLPLLFFIPLNKEVILSNWYYLLFLGIFTTAIGHTLFIKSLRHFSVSTVSILSNFTPVVGISLGILFLHEKPSPNILMGGSLILLTALIEVWLGLRRK